MIKINISEEDKKALNYERFYHPHPRVQLEKWGGWLKKVRTCLLNDLCLPVMINPNIGL